MVVPAPLGEVFPPNCLCAAAWCRQATVCAKQQATPGGVREMQLQCSKKSTTRLEAELSCNNLFLYAQMSEEKYFETDIEKYTLPYQTIIILQILFKEPS